MLHYSGYPVECVENSLDYSFLDEILQIRCECFEDKIIFAFSVQLHFYERNDFQKITWVKT